MPFGATKRTGRALLGVAAIAAVVFLAGWIGGSRTAAALSNCGVSDMTLDAEEREFLRLINEYRAQNGRPALTVSQNLNRSAAWMARDMAVENYFSHTDSLGRSPAARVANCDGSPYTGENIAAGTIKDTAAEAFEMWRTSPGHNANMLEAAYVQIGIARHFEAGSRYSWYWVTDFSTTYDGTNALGGGGSSPPAVAPLPDTAAEMLGPALGSRLAGTQTFTWSPGNNAREYFFFMGTFPGANDMVGVSMGSATSVTVIGLPATGQPIFVRLWTLTSTGWQYNDYAYFLPQ